jgi:hypothetical protein
MVVPVCREGGSMNILSSILKNASGEFEVGRTLLVYGGFMAFTTPPVFMAWAMHRGQQYDITAYCLAYAGLIVSLAPVILSIGKKGKDDATARQINQGAAQ